VLGAFQVSVKGDLANWHTGAEGSIPAVGGAMDLATGARQVFVMMDHLTKTGESKLVPECTYPLTGIACVSRIYTDLAILDVTSEGLKVREIVADITFEALQELSGVPLIGLFRSMWPSQRPASRRYRRRQARRLAPAPTRTPLPLGVWVGMAST
jgi:3-oxoadipate CoA-transferase beta subunit